MRTKIRIFLKNLLITPYITHLLIRIETLEERNYAQGVDLIRQKEIMEEMFEELTLMRKIYEQNSTKETT